MKSEQKVAILVWHWTSKARKKDGKAPVYIRITIEGKEEEISTGKFVHPHSTPENRDAKWLDRYMVLGYKRI